MKKTTLLLGISSIILCISNLSAESNGIEEDVNNQSYATQHDQTKSLQKPIQPSPIQTNTIHPPQKPMQGSFSDADQREIESIHHQAIKEQKSSEKPQIIYVYAKQPEKADDKSKTDDEYKSEISTNPLLCFGRGLTNIATCWLEIPRCIVYDNELIPVIGTILGIPEGAGYTVVRLLVGTADIISFGMSGDALYGKYLPDFIWEANWVPPEKKAKKQ
jgi:putative exosortase-associated protein (TIGR04073 family)